MTQIKDGGAAFPLPYENTSRVKKLHSEGEIDSFRAEKMIRSFAGMTLRDYFAIRAFQTRLAKHNDWTLTEITDQAWRDADTMIRARGTQ